MLGVRSGVVQTIAAHVFDVPIIKISISPKRVVENKNEK